MFPYEKYRDSELWQRVDTILAELEENRDISLTTARDYVIGYFCKKLTEPDVE